MAKEKPKWWHAYATWVARGLMVLLGAGFIGMAVKAGTYMEKVDRIETDLFKLTVCKNSRPTIRWEGPMDELPFEYQRIKVEVDLDRAAKDLKAGVWLPSQFNVVEGTHLRIK